jgi:hypothetical protein
LRAAALFADEIATVTTVTVLREVLKAVENPCVLAHLRKPPAIFLDNKKSPERSVFGVFGGLMFGLFDFLFAAYV